MCFGSVASALRAEPARGAPKGVNDGLTINDVPTAGVFWPKCTTDAQVYCFEQHSVITPDGTETQPMMGAPYVNCHDSDQVAEPCAFDGSYWMEMGVNGGIDNNPAALPNTYRWKVRLGKFSPDILMLGDTQKTVVGGNETTGWTLEIWAKPAVKAYKTGCYTPSMCGDSSVAESLTYAISGYLRTLGIGKSWPSVATTELRDSLRGTFISTNGMSQSWTFAADTFKVNAISPHFLPGGTEMTPGFVKVWLPSSYLVSDRGYQSLTEITADRIALTRYKQDAVPTVSIVNGGLLVDTGVTHFSDPEPTIRVLKAAEQVRSVLTANNGTSSGSGTTSGGTTSGATTSGGTTTATPANYVRTSASGAKATLTINLASAQTVKIYRKVGSKLTLLKSLAAKKGTNKYVTVYKTTYSFVVKDAKGKVIAPLLSSTAYRFGLRYLS